VNFRSLAQGFLEQLPEVDTSSPMLDKISTLLVEGNLASLPASLSEHGLTRWLPVTDSNLARCLDWSWAPRPPLVVPAGESSKSLAQTEQLYAQLAEAAVDRRTAVVAVGGGVVGDLAGFVAATYLRGLPLVQVPTSLVAQVDSSVGGKVGVDLPQGKNLVGAFHPAALIYLDADLLETLPDDQWNSGMAEVLKHGLLDGPDHWAALENLCYPLSSDRRRQMVLRSRQVKLEVVAADPFERGVRAHLNLGHTVAHAIESAQGYSGWNHGEAVAFGLRVALRLSERVLGLDPIWDERLAEQLSRYRLPRRAPQLQFEELRTFLSRDKKNVGGELRFVLLRQPGQPQVCSDVTWDMLRETWEELR
jgi:3-dehydroquinate synthase